MKNLRTFKDSILIILSLYQIPKHNIKTKCVNNLKPDQGLNSFLLYEYLYKKSNKHRMSVFNLK